MIDADKDHNKYSLIGYLLLIATIIFGCWGFAHELHFVDVQFSDVAFHLSVLKALDFAVKSGQNPLDFWYDTTPYGFALFRSYQYFPYLIIYGFYRLAAEQFSLATVLASSTFLLASALLPLSVFYSLRLIGTRILECGIAATLAVLISDGSEYGMGLQNFTFGTVGIINQLWAIVFIFPAIAASFQYIWKGKNLGIALLFSFLTFGSHVVAAVILGVCLVAFSLGLALTEKSINKRPIIFLALFVITTAHQWYFILSDAAYINRSQLEPAWKYDGRGFEYLIDLFWKGDLFDCNRFPVVTLLLLITLPYLIIFSKRIFSEPAGKFFVFAPFLIVLFFTLCAGRQLWGWIFNLLPVLQSLHVHRFAIGIHLFGILIISLGLGTFIRSFAHSRMRQLLCFFLILLILRPAAIERAEMFELNHQRQRDTATYIEKDQDLNKMLQALKKQPYGWTYVGSRNSWQNELLVAGYIPLDIMTTTRGIPTVGGILYHAFSLAGETLFDFDSNNPAHFKLFGIRNIVSPSAWQGTAGFNLVGRFGRYAIWSRESHMIFVADQRFSSNADFSAKTESARRFVQQYLGPQGSNGQIISQEMKHAWRFSAKAEMESSGTLVAATGYHPNWKAFVDGQPTVTRRVPPGLIGIDITEGQHSVEFVYQGSQIKLLLLLFAVVIIIFSFFVPVRGARAVARLLGPG